MSSMNGLQRESMRRAMCGDWDLADAIELRHRITNTDRDEDCVAGIRQGGRLRFLVYVNDRANLDIHCQDCGGNGETDSDDESLEASPCEGCSGTGITGTPFSANEDFEYVRRIEDLNGDAIFDFDAGIGSMDCLFESCDSLLVSNWADKTIAEYHVSLAKPTQVDITLPRAA